MTKSKQIKALEKENAEIKGKLIDLMDFANSTSKEGAGTFPVNEDEYIGAVETLCIQEMKGLKSSNILEDGMRKYEVNDGKVIEKSVMKMAQANAFDRDAWDKTPIDPSAYVKYWNNWESRQYGVTLRTNDIRKIIANKGLSAEDVATIVLDTLTQGEGKDDYIDQVKLLFSAEFKNYSSNLGGEPKSIKGVTYALRDMYNHLKSDNNDMTEHDWVSSTPASDIRIAVSDKLLNLIDVTELANVFNLSKEELFGKIVVFNLSILKELGYSDQEIEVASYRAFVYDVNALFEATRLREFSKDISGKGLFTNFYLTVEKLHGHTGLMKGAYLNCAVACINAKNDIIQAVTTVTVTNTLSHVTAEKDITSFEKYARFNNRFICGEGYNLLGEGAVATVTVGGTAVEGAVTIAEDGKSCEVAIPVAYDNIVITLTAVAD